LFLRLTNETCRAIIVSKGSMIDCVSMACFDFFMKILFQEGTFYV
jgi:hypothetical protein